MRIKKAVMAAAVIAALALGGCKSGQTGESAGGGSIEQAGDSAGSGSIGQTAESGAASEAGLESIASAEQSTEEADKHLKKKELPSDNRNLFAMDTFMAVTAYGEQCSEAVEAAEEEIRRLDSLLSTGDADSEIGKLNRQGEASLSEDTRYLLERSLRLAEETDGAFDIAIYPVMKAWGFTDGNYRVPSREQLDQLLPLCDVSLIQLDPDTGTVSFQEEGVQIDLGGIAKGYASSQIIKLYQEYGIESGIVNLGGNVQTLGRKPDGSRWRIAIQHPLIEDEKLGVLSVQDRAVITSGGYERYFEMDGNTYHHIIDPTSGEPAKNGLISVTIISRDGALADGLSTSLFIMGKEKAEAFWRAHSDQFDAIMLTDDGTLYVTEGAADDFEAEYDPIVITNSSEK